MQIIGKSAMVFPTPQIDGFEDKAGTIYKKGQFQVRISFLPYDNQTL